MSSERVLVNAERAWELIQALSVGGSEVSFLTQTEEDEEYSLKAIAIGIIQSPTTRNAGHVASYSSRTATGFDPISVAVSPQKVGRRINPFLPELDILPDHIAMLGSYSNSIYQRHGILSCRGIGFLIPHRRANCGY